MDMNFKLFGFFGEFPCQKIRRLKARSVCKRDKRHVKGKVKTRLPEDTVLTLTLDGENAQHVFLDSRGRAKFKWTRTEGRTVCISECQDIECVVTKPCE